MAISIKRFNWTRTPSAWESTSAWHTRQQQARVNFEASNSAANSSLFGASVSLTTGLGSIATNTASQRAQADALAKALDTLA
jgi:hypothetical protein